MFHLCPACNQDIHPSKGKFLCCARLYICVLYATFVPPFSSFSSRCSIFQRGKLFACSVCVHVYHVCNFRAVKMFYLLAASRQDVPSFGGESCVCIYVGVHVHCVCNFYGVKMFHLSARKVVFVCVCVCALCVQLSCCQDVSSFGSFSSRCSIFRRGKLRLYVCVYVHCVCNFRAVKMFHLSSNSLVYILLSKG